MKISSPVVAVAVLFLSVIIVSVASPALAKRSVASKPVITSFYASPQTISSGQSTTLRWSVSGATSLSIDQGVGTVTKSSKVVSPKGSVVYTLTASNSAGVTTATTSVTVQTPPPPTSGEVFIQAYTTSYSIWDNTPAGSTAIAYPVLHQAAGGTGTYADPITIAVGYSIINGQSILDYPVGTKFYIPNVRRYFIVEDVCGDSATPQNGPCHTGYPSGTTTWVDMWIDGASGTQSQVSACAAFLTDTNGVAHLLIRNPASNYAVTPGAIFQNGSCTQQYGNTPVTL